MTQYKWHDDEHSIILRANFELVKQHFFRQIFCIRKIVSFPNICSPLFECTMFVWGRPSDRGE